MAIMKEIIKETGFFKEQYKKFRKTVPDKDLKSFAMLKSDVERWQFVKAKNGLEFPTHRTGRSKNFDDAMHLKAQGNKCFQEGKNANALSFYTQSLISFPSNGDKTELSIIRANRSAALYHLEEFEPALNDINTALSLGYPKHLHHKVMDRKARCLMGLKQNKAAVQALRETISALDDAKIPADNQQKKQRDIQIMLGLMMKNKLYDEELGSEAVKSKIKGEKNTVYKAVSKAVSFGYSESEGRFAQADSEIKSGDVILREKAHCAVLLQENSKTHCFQCMMRVYIAEPCPNCVEVIFCSARCRDLALKTHHKYECSILKTLWDSGASITCLMAIRIVTQKSLSYFIKLAEYMNEKGAAQIEKDYNGLDYLTVYNLVKHEDKRSTEDMFHRTYMALFLFECLKKSGYFDVNDVNEDEQLKGEGLVAGLILRHLQSLQFNAHEISELILNSNDAQNWNSIFVGAGLFPTLALFNHSCDPSIIRCFEGSRVVVRAIKNIKQGESIYENYGPIFTQTEKKERQTTLKNQYWFDCNCEPCMRKWPIIDHMDSSTIRFHCENSECDNVVTVPLNTATFMVQCNKCNKHTNILKGLKVLQDSENLFRLGQNYLQTGEILKAFKKFLELQFLLSDTLVPPFKDFYICQQNVRNCIMAMGNTHPPLHKFIKSQKVASK